MPQSLDDLVALLDLETIEDNLFRGTQPHTGLQRVFGGQVAGQALVAAVRTVATDRVVHSLHAYFLRPGDPSVPIVYDVEIVRDGRSFSTRRVVARQHGRAIFYLTASFHTPESGFDHQDVMPDAPAPENCPTLGEFFERISGVSRDAWEREWAALEVRYIGDSRDGGTLEAPDHPALARLWLRAAGRLPDDPTMHACVLTYASDLTLLGATLVPHGTHIGAPGLQTASLDHTIWFHRPFDAASWHLEHFVCQAMVHSRGVAVGSIFDAHGAHVATVSQEVLFRSRR